MQDKDFNQKLADAKRHLTHLDQDLKILDDLMERRARGEYLSQDDLPANDNKKTIANVVGDLALTSDIYWQDFAYSQVSIAIDKLQATVLQIDILRELQKRLPEFQVIPNDIILHQEFTDNAHKWVSDTLPFLRNKGASTKDIDADVLSDTIDLMVEGEELTESDGSVKLETREDLLLTLDEGKLKIAELSLSQMVERINMSIMIFSNFIDADDKNIDLIEQQYPHLGLEFISETIQLVRRQIPETQETIAEIDQRLSGQYTSSPAPVYSLDLKY